MDEDIKQPTTFSNVPHEFVFKRSASSVFFVLATFNQSYRLQALRYLKETLGASDQEADDAINKVNLSTGFAIRETNASYQILTTAHIFGNFYSGTVNINVNQLNQWFQVSVLCQHYEKNMAARLPHLYSDPAADPRRYSPATIERFDSSKDLMLLRVAKNSLYCDNKYTVCGEAHRSVPYCRIIPAPPSDVIMLAWPPCRPESPMVGRVVSTSRVYGQITQVLTKGYNMELYELDITGDDGCSGAPILNQIGQLLCVYHGRLNSVGYGITAAEVRTFCGF